MNYYRVEFRHTITTGKLPGTKYRYDFIQARHMIDAAYEAGRARLDHNEEILSIEKTLPRRGIKVEWK